jgi:hypothetical protein
MEVFIMGRYIECGEENVYKYALNQPSEMDLINTKLKIGKLKRYSSEESYGNGCDVLILKRGDINKLREYFYLELKGEENENSLEKANFLKMIHHIIEYSNKYPKRNTFVLDSEF